MSWSDYDDYPVRTWRWSTEEVRELSTKQIIRKLKNFGVEFTEKKFLKEVKRFLSAEDLAKHWEKIYHINAAGYDVDFIWMASVVLWERLAPEVFSSEMIDDRMQFGYELLDSRRVVEACEIWLEVWERLKPRFTAEMKSIRDADKVFSGMQSVYNWCQQFEQELGNAGIEDSIFHEKRIQYCREFYTMFPESDPLILINMKRAEAEALFELGRIEEGERAFEALIKEFPDSVWGYIGWGDMYSIFRPEDYVPFDYEKAKKIYRMGLEKATDNREVLLSRLESLEKEKKKHTANR
jgi:tetratricopeptide (TPR) repeat protein